LNIEKDVLAVLDEALGLRGRAATFNAETPLLGALPELDSMAVVTVITMLEERFNFVVEDDDLDAQTFETVGTIVAFVDRNLRALAPER
jgi:acyl carrier protein